MLIKKSIIQRSDEWLDNENTTELMNNITNQCQETSESVDSKAAECNESSNSNSNSNTQENSKKPTLNGNQFKEAILSSSTNSFAAAPSETKKNTSSQNTS